MAIKAGFISYLNAYPFLFPFENHQDENWQLTIDRPGTLNAKLRAGELDISLISSLEYAANFQDYEIVPHIALSSKGYVDSVKLISKRDFKDLNGAHIAVTNSSASSIVILKVLLKHWNIQATFEAYQAQDDIPQNFDAALTIGDEAMIQEDGLYKYSFDLGQMWQEVFQRNVVFAIAAVRKESLAQNAKEIQRLVAKLQQAPKDSAQNEAELAKACSKNFPKINNHLDYLKLLDYDLDEQRISNLQFMFDKAYQAGLLERAVELNFLNSIVQ